MSLCRRRAGTIQQNHLLKTLDLPSRVLIVIEAGRGRLARPARAFRQLLLETENPLHL